MPHVLVVSYYFPPIGGTTVRRVLRFLRYLPRLGWRCTVVCADRPHHPFHPDDPEALSALPPVEAVLRAPARPWLEKLMGHGQALLQAARPGSDGDDSDGRVGRRLRRLLHETVAFPDPKWLWIRGAVQAALARAREAPYDVVFATGYPWSAFVAAERVARKLGVPFVLDFRDAWTLDPREIWDAPRNRRLERDLISQAANVTAATDWIRDRMRERCPEVAAERITTLTNGYDPEESPGAAPELAVPDRFVLTYTGTFNDTLPPSSFDQTPYYLIEAVSRLEARERALLRIRLVGNLGPLYRAHIRRLGLAEVIEVIDPVSHTRSLQYQLASDVLLVVVYDCAQAPAVLTGKILEYVGARKPILALAPEGEASKLVWSHSLGWVEPPRDVERIRNRLAQLIESWQSGSLPVRLAGVPEFSAELLTGRLARILEGSAQTRVRRDSDPRMAGSPPQRSQAETAETQ
jgi:glycosyltransferase involved in cell wall biosynthesis